jgi:uncharacterized repeat protein (TIGR02543 family)
MSKDKKKKIIIASIIGVILLAIIIFLLWFFNRKFDVTFDYNNGIKNEIVQVKYNKTINEKDIKDKDDLGESFINWYEVVEVKDNKEVLAEKPFDFKTKITKKTKLKATYTAEVETITITFDSKGGSKIDDITLNKGVELTLPKDPTYDGYTFKGWEDKNGTPIYDKALLEEDTTLYAKWEKVEEKISLSLSRRLIHANGYNTSNAKATTKNVSGKVTYSINSDACMTIDANTGVITAKAKPIKGGSLAMYNRDCANGAKFTVTAKTPSGKSATASIQYEADLVLNFNGTVYQEDQSLVGTNGKSYKITATNPVVKDWKITPADGSNQKYEGKIYTNTSSELSGEGNGFERYSTGILVTATSNAGQTIKTKISFVVN